MCCTKGDNIMAITRKSQILNTNKVYDATDILDDVVKYLQNAKGSLLLARNRCDYTVFETNEGNSFPSKIDVETERIASQINAIRKLSLNIERKAYSIYSEENREYQEYLRRQEESID